MFCGLAPLNGWKPKSRSPAGKVAFPDPSTVSPAGEVPRSQCETGLQFAGLGSLPSHCSTNTVVPGVKPLTVTVNDWGLPAPSPGTAKGSLPTRAGPTQRRQPPETSPRTPDHSTTERAATTETTNRTNQAGTDS